MGEDGVGPAWVVSFDTWEMAGPIPSRPFCQVKAPSSGLFPWVNQVTAAARGHAHPIDQPQERRESRPAMLTDVEIKLDPDGTVDVSYKGFLLLANVATGYTRPPAGSPSAPGQAAPMKPTSSKT